MRRRDMHYRSVRAYPVNLIHRCDQVRAVLDNVVGVDLAEAIFRKRPRQIIEIVNNVGINIGHAVEIDCVVDALTPASKIERRAHTIERQASAAAFLRCA